LLCFLLKPDWPKTQRGTSLRRPIHEDLFFAFLKYYPNQKEETGPTRGISQDEEGSEQKMNLPRIELYTRPGTLIKIEGKETKATDRLRPGVVSLISLPGKVSTHGEARVMAAY
jgi:hypothetical protein